MTAHMTAHAQVAQPSPPCAPAVLGEAVVAAVQDGRTFRTTDGREVRLAAIAPPPRAGEDPASNETARSALARALGHDVGLEPVGPGPDRYGRLLAHAFRTESGAPVWIEHELVSGGHAVASGSATSEACLRLLLSAEDGARAARRGFWSDPNFAIRNADDGRALALVKGRFTIVQGKVLSVREAGGTIYVNFGRIWRRSLTVTIAKRRERAFKAAGIEPKRLEGRHIRVRGWLDQRIGPTIEANGPEQIELTD